MQKWSTFLKMSVLCDSGKRFPNVQKHPRWLRKGYLKAGSEALRDE
jgi:hypothetical protein